MSIITTKINLAGLTHVKMTTKKGTKGIFLPFDLNHLFVSKETGAVYLDLVAFPVANPKYDNTHIVKQSLSKDIRDKMSEEEQKKMPILGNLNDGSKYERQEANNDAGDGATFTEESDDLPF